MRTPKLFLGIFALALILPLMLLACGGPDKPTDGTSQERSTAEPTDLPDSERATDEPETPVSPGRMPSTPESGDAPTATDAPAATTATVPPTVTDAPVPATAPPAASGSAETDREALVAIYNATDGENWNRSDNWLSDAPLDEWEGVTTDDEGRVTKLNGKLDRGDTGGQPANSVPRRQPGEIPAELGSLTSLTASVPLQQPVDRVHTRRLAKHTGQ